MVGQSIESWTWTSLITGSEIRGHECIDTGGADELCLLVECSAESRADAGDLSLRRVIGSQI